VSVSEYATTAVREQLDQRPPAFKLVTADSMTTDWVARRDI
jgi:hypothetical protein